MTGSHLLYIFAFRSNLLLRKLIPLNKSSYCYNRYFATKSASELRDDYENSLYFAELKNSFREKVIYHSFYKYEDFLLTKKKEYVERIIKEKKLRKLSVVPVSLKYILDDENNSSPELADSTKEGAQSVVLPFEVSKVTVPLKDHEVNFSAIENSEDVSDKLGSDTLNELIIDDNFQKACTGKWMKDYDCYEEIEEEEESDNVVNYSSRKKYGTPDPSIPMSNVPCGGCGAHLHCQDPGIPGYLPSEIFTSCSTSDLRGLTCQRCHFMKNYDTALAVSVDSSSYPKLLSRIKHQNALVILLVDITDFPCSVWPGITDVIGPENPLFVIGNKVDLIYGDRKGWLSRSLESFKATLPKKANIVYTSLISAKTGFGVEELINKLHRIWEYKGDVYLVGCTNVGKSTLFNALLASDYCKVQASDLLQRATTAPWPGTTMNLLKFPILRPSGTRIFLRAQRLREDKMIHAAEKRIWDIQTRKTNFVEPVQLVGHIGRTFSKGSERDDVPDPFLSNGRQNMNMLPESGLDPNHPDFKKSRWFYDTPGVVHPDQIIDLLTTEELMKTLPKTPIVPTVFLFRKDWTLFIAGLGRVDLLELSECKDSLMKLVVFCPSTLPVIICETKVADELYNEYIGSPMFVVPFGGPDRLKLWPSLKPNEDIVLVGKSMNECCSDIVLSNAGWVSPALREGHICKFRCWTPDARGIYVRKIPLMRYAVSVHGKRISKTPAYGRKYFKEAGMKIT